MMRKLSEKIDALMQEAIDTVEVIHRSVDVHPRGAGLCNRNEVSCYIKTAAGNPAACTLLCMN